VESTPVSTPVSCVAGENFTSHHIHQLPEHSSSPYRKDSHPVWPQHAPHDDFILSNDILFTDDGNDAELIYLPPTTPHPYSDFHSSEMPSPPIAIATSRQSSGSPRTQQSNLTSQLQQPRIDVAGLDGAQNTEPAVRQESIGMLGTTPYGARSIPMQDRARRPSNNFAPGSFMGGMGSWGGMSMSSYVREEWVTTSACV
jgi:hypothetical protein